jgi:hypothetical protein
MPAFEPSQANLILADRVKFATWRALWHTESVKKLTLSLVLTAELACAETWSGTVVDVNCMKNDLASHTRECALSCSRSGYGIVLADGKFVKFDERGNAKALAALKASTKEKGLKATVTGSSKDGVIQVETIQIQ